MNDRRINDLVRMALEAEELDSSAAGGLRLVGAGDDEFGPRRAAESRRGWWVGAGLAAAAAVAGAVMLPGVFTFPAREATGGGLAEKPVGPVGPAVTVTDPDQPIVRHQNLTGPTEQPSLAVGHDRPDLGSVEQCILVTIYRDMRKGDHCVQFQRQVWPGNKCDADPSDLRGITLGQPCLASANQTLLVALSGPQRELPKTEKDAQGLANCILGTARDCGSDSGCLSSAAVECVPAHVSVKLEAVANLR